jgi:hypothetical protein
VGGRVLVVFFLLAEGGEGGWKNTKKLFDAFYKPIEKRKNY